MLNIGRKSLFDGFLLTGQVPKIKVLLCLRNKNVRLSVQGQRCGETHPNARLTDHDVELMRQLHEGGMQCSKIAHKFDCARTTVSGIVNYQHRVAIPMSWKNTLG
jgi:hypothetical protein